MDMYAACCGDMDRARAAFEEIGVKNSVTWTALITGYTHRGDGYGALDVFRQMLLVCSDFTCRLYDFELLLDLTCFHILLLIGGG